MSIELPAVDWSAFETAMADAQHHADAEQARANRAAALRAQAAEARAQAAILADAAPQLAAYAETAAAGFLASDQLEASLRKMGIRDAMTFGNVVVIQQAALELAQEAIAGRDAAVTRADQLMAEAADLEQQADAA